MALLMSLGAAVYSYFSTATAPPRPRRCILSFRAAASPAALDRRRRPQNVAGDFFVGEQSCKIQLLSFPFLQQQQELCLTAARCLPFHSRFHPLGGGAQTSAASTARPADGWRR
jgi:hypothetical protein